MVFFIFFSGLRCTLPHKRQDLTYAFLRFYLIYPPLREQKGGRLTLRREANSFWSSREGSVGETMTRREAYEVV